MLSLHFEQDAHGFLSATDGRTLNHGYGTTLAEATYNYMDGFRRNHRFIQECVRWRKRQHIDLGHWQTDLDTFDELAPDVDTYFSLHRETDGRTETTSPDP